MKLLLDTHVFLWWNMDDARLSETVRETILNTENTLYLSAASAWEIALKCANGKLSLPEEVDNYVVSRMQINRIEPLPIQISHALEVHNLPKHHSDPFDRLLVAQSILEKIPLATADSRIKMYDIEIFW